MLKDLLPLLQLQDILWIGGVGAVAIVTAVQALSKRVKPWSYLIQQFGRAINKETLERMKELSDKMDRIETHDAAQDERMAEAEARGARRRILRFADEVKRREKHSEESFNEVLDDITRYERYCEDNPRFLNGKTEASVAVIKEVYADCLRDGSFL